MLRMKEVWQLISFKTYIGNKANNFNETEFVIGSVMQILKNWPRNGIIWI